MVIRSKVVKNYYSTTKSFQRIMIHYVMFNYYACSSILLFGRQAFLLPPANDVLGQGNVFTSVCDSVHIYRGWLPRMHHRLHDQGGLHPQGSASNGICIQMGLPPGGLHRKGEGWPNLPPHTILTSEWYASYWNEVPLNICEI